MTIYDNSQKYISEYKDVVITPCSYVIDECHDREGRIKISLGDGTHPIMAYPSPNIVRQEDLTVLSYLERSSLTKTNFIIPKIEDKDTRDTCLQESYWVEMSVVQFKELCDEVSEAVKKNEFSATEKYRNYRVCLFSDTGLCAHRSDFLFSCRKMKDMMPEMMIMVGLVGDPRIACAFSEAGVDYCILGISTDCGISYPNVSLLMQVVKELKSNREGNDKRKNTYMSRTRMRVIAYGGINTTEDAIKALSLGADHVMLKGQLEACVGTSGNYCYEVEAGNHMYADIKEPDALEDLVNNGNALVDDDSLLYRDTEYVSVGHNLFKKIDEKDNLDATFLKINDTLSSYLEKFESQLRQAIKWSGQSTLLNFRNFSNKIFLDK